MNDYHHRKIEPRGDARATGYQTRRPERVAELLRSIPGKVPAALVGCGVATASYFLAEKATVIRDYVDYSPTGAAVGAGFGAFGIACVAGLNDRYLDKLEELVRNLGERDPRIADKPVEPRRTAFSDPPEHRRHRGGLSSYREFLENYGRQSPRHSPPEATRDLRSTP